tara:strand:+ start:7297 stop:7587 length:291 start_codon:yes stop_codon:yes gene_type:complete
MKPFSFNQRVENLYKSYFSSYSNINIELNEKKISIHIIDADNFDSASIDLVKFEDFYQITFWDGYSQSEIIEAFNDKDSAKTLKRFMKKLTKILER